MHDMSGAELERWAAFDKLEPISRWEQRHQLANLCAMLFNANRGRDANGMPIGEALEADAFLAQSPVDRREKELERMIAGLRAIAVPYTGKKRKKRRTRRN